MQFVYLKRQEVIIRVRVKNNNMTLIMANQNQNENKFKSDLNKIKKEDINERRNKCMVQY